MKKMMIALVAMLTMSVSTHAMSYEQARNEALFLTDKMAYELNLTDEQYEAAYEINLDYLMGVTSVDDVYGTYWERRNLDMSYILLEAQWNAFIAASYFYRPLYWDAGYWHFGVYARYPHRDYFYFGRPHFYATYRGGHAWHRIGGHGYYYGHRDHFRHHHGDRHFGMRDGWNRGDYRHGRNHGSTHVGRHHGNDGRYNGGGHHGNYGNHGNHGTGTRPGTGTRRDPGNSRHHGTVSGTTPRIGHTPNGSLTPNRGTVRTETSPSTRSHGSFGGGSHIGGSGTRSGGGFSGTRPGGSHGGGGHFGGGSHGGGSHGGGGHFGGRR